MMSILEMSFSGAVMILVILLIRMLAINRLPKKAFPVLWVVALVRLLVPYTLPSAFSIYSLSGRLVRAARIAFSPDASGISNAFRVSGISGGEPVPGISEVSEAAVAMGEMAGSISPWAVVWFFGTMACVVVFVISYVKCRRVFRVSVPVDNAFAREWLKEHQLRRTICIRESDRICSPLTYGVLHPVILMPKKTDWNDRDTLKFVLAHEYMHIRHLDVVVKIVLAAALCVHWFNPMVWVMYVLANRDIEFACDESVVVLFGERAKSEYAMTLIRMEEVKSGLIPFCGNFSYDAIEERIISIMKMKKKSVAALAVTGALVIGVAAVFATSGQAEERTAETSTYPVSDVVWWTADEYAAWLENEKVELQSIIGSQGWTQSTGWFVWTQEKVDETIALYESILEDIKNGVKVSKSVDGDENTMLAMGMESIAFSRESEDVVAGMEVAQTAVQGCSEDILADYAPFGLTYDEVKNALYYGGRLVRYFFDGFAVEGGTATIYDFVNEGGVVDVYAIREATENGDGSINPGGRLVGIAEYSQEEFDSRDIAGMLASQGTIEATAVGYGPVDGVTFEERFAPYKDYGIVYVEALNASGAGNVYLEGQLVNVFSDVTPSGSAFSFHSARQGGINVRTLYNSEGKLVGMETY